MCPGLCKSDLARNYYNKGILLSIAVAVFYTTFARSSESGARTLVLSAMTGPEEHGKYIRHYGTDDEYVECVLLSPLTSGKGLLLETGKQRGTSPMRRRRNCNQRCGMRCSKFLKLHSQKFQTLLFQSPDSLLSTYLSFYYIILAPFGHCSHTSNPYAVIYHLPCAYSKARAHQCISMALKM